MAVKGFYDNPQEATIGLASTDLLAIQATNASDMKKITYENFVKPFGNCSMTVSTTSCPHLARSDTRKVVDARFFPGETGVL